MVTEYFTCVERATEYPRSGVLISGLRVKFEVRRFLLDRFPYSVIAACLEDELVVVAIAHHSRKPGYWRKRLAKVEP